MLGQCSDTDTDRPHWCDRRAPAGVRGAIAPSKPRARTSSRATPPRCSRSSISSSCSASSRAARTSPWATPASFVACAGLGVPTPPVASAVGEGPAAAAVSVGPGCMEPNPAWPLAVEAGRQQDVCDMLPSEYSCIATWLVVPMLPMTVGNASPRLWLSTTCWQSRLWRHICMCPRTTYSVRTLILMILS